MKPTIWYKVIKLTYEIVAMAIERDHRKRLKDSATEGEGNLSGALGEIVVLDHYRLRGCKVDEESTYDYDMTVDGLHYEVKTRRRTVPPNKLFSCLIPALQRKQQCDVYVFVQYDVDEKLMYILGSITKKKFFSLAVFHKKDSVEPGTRFKYPMNTYSTPCGNLTPAIENP